MRSAQTHRMRAPSVGVDAATELRAAIEAKARAIAGDDVEPHVVLEVPRTATREQAHEAYLRLARRFHPDVVASLGLADLAPVAARLFQRITEAEGRFGESSGRETLSPGAVAAVIAQDGMQRHDARVHYERALKLLERGEIQAAVGLIREAARKSPDEPCYQAALAWADAAVAPAERRAVALRTADGKLRALAAAHGDCAEAHFYTAEIHRMAGRSTEARKAYRTALDRRPGYRDAERELRRLSAREPDAKPSRWPAWIGRLIGRA